MISDKLMAVLELCAVPFDQRQPWDVTEALSQQEGIPLKVAYRRVEKAADRGLIDYGTSLSGAWLTEKGRLALNRKSVHIAPISA